MKKQKKHQKVQKQRKLGQEEKISVPQKYIELWAKYKNKIILSCLLIALIAGFSYNYIVSIQKASQTSWAMLSDVWNIMLTGKSNSSNLFVKDLPTPIVSSVKEALGDIESIPEEMRDEKVKTLDMLPVNNIPSPLKTKILREYNIKRLESQFQVSQRTNAAPWLAYCLAQLYFFNNQPRQSLYYYNLITSAYPKHPLHNELVQLQEWDTLKQEIDWVQKQQTLGNQNQSNAQEKNRIVVFTTPKGKFEVELFEKEYPKNIENFVSLVQKGSYNGINFHQITKYTLHSGCPLGNGKGSFVSKTKADLKDRMLQRGLLIMENTEKEEEIDSRFIIFKKYPMVSNQKRYAFVGKVVEEGMKVVDSLTPSDILLDVSMKQ